MPGHGVSHLMNGHFSRFSTEKLLDFLKRLDQKVTIRIREHRPGEPYQEVGFGLGTERSRRLSESAQRPDASAEKMVADPARPVYCEEAVCGIEERTADRAAVPRG